MHGVAPHMCGQVASHPVRRGSRGSLPRRSLAQSRRAATSQPAGAPSTRYTDARPILSALAMSTGRMPCAFNSRTRAASIEGGRPCRRQRPWPLRSLQVGAHGASWSRTRQRRRACPVRVSCGNDRGIRRRFGDLRVGSIQVPAHDARQCRDGLRAVRCPRRDGLGLSQARQGFFVSRSERRTARLPARSHGLS